MPMLRTFDIHESCCKNKIRHRLTYLPDGVTRRDLAWDFINILKQEENEWDAVMDQTRFLHRHDVDWEGKPSRKFYHFILSPDPSDQISLDNLQELTLRWATDCFGGPTEDDYDHNGVLGDYEVAIVYHNDNGIPHSHLIVNCSNLENGKKLQMNNHMTKCVLPNLLQSIAKDMGLSHFKIWFDVEKDHSANKAEDE